MISPCNRICVMDAEGRYCIGCARTLDEIVLWTTMSDAERTLVLASLAARQVARSKRPDDRAFPA